VQQPEFESDGMSDIDQLLNAVEWTSLYEPLLLPVGLSAQLGFAKSLARALSSQHEMPQGLPLAAPGSSPVDLLLEGLPG
jgi:hypothetical protein